MPATYDRKLEAYATSNPMTFRSIARRIHLWLGLTTGLVVFVVALSGSLYVFEREIRD